MSRTGLKMKYFWPKHVAIEFVLMKTNMKLWGKAVPLQAWTGPDGSR